MLGLYLDNLRFSQQIFYSEFKHTKNYLRTGTKRQGIELNEAWRLVKKLVTKQVNKQYINVLYK